MKNWISSLLAIAVVSIFFACQTSGSAENNAAASNTTPATTPAAPTAPSVDGTTPPTPNKPDFQVKAEEMAKTVVNWAGDEHNYGQVPSGTKVTHQFRFKNTGSQPLTLTRVKASCGCTTPSYSKEPVAPGEEGFIDVAFNTTGKSGRQTKTVTVTGNFEGSITKVLKITGEVLKAESK